MITRRRFTTVLGGAAAAWPFAARAQQRARVPRIGVLMPFDDHDPVIKPRVFAFTRALADLGWTDGRNLRIDVRWAGAGVNAIRTFAQELVGLQPEIILADGAGATAAVQRETRTIPILFANVGDPVRSGIVARLDRPGGNVTGFVDLEASLGGKWLELLAEIVPELKRAAIVFNPDTTPVAAYMPSFETAARSLNIAAITAPVHSDVEIDAAIMALRRQPGSGLVVVPDDFMIAYRASIILAAARNRVPAVYSLSYFARNGGLLSYGVDPLDTFRRAAVYADRILRGEKPGDLAVQFPVKDEMAVNLRAAEALGLAVPPSILLRADEVFE